MGALTTHNRQRGTASVIRLMGLFGTVKMLTIICSLVRNKVIAMVIGPSGVGLVILYNSVSDLVSTCSRLNIDTGAVREIAIDSREQQLRVAAVVMRWAVFLGLGGTLVLCLLSPLLSYIGFGTVNNWWSYCLLGLAPLSYTLVVCMQSIMQGLHKFADIARASAWTAIVGIVITVPIIYWLKIDSIIWVIVIYSVVNLAMTAYYRVRIPRMRLPWREVWKRGRGFVTLGIWMTAGLAATQASNYIFVTYFNYSTSTTELGIYQGGYTILNTYVGVLFSGLWMEYFPKISATVHSRRRTCTLVSHRMATIAWILMPVSAAFMACDELLVRLVYSSAFLSMLPYITIGMAGVVLRSTSWCLTNTILARGHGRLYFVTEAISGSVYLAANVAGYKLGGFVGLGVAFIVWYVIYTGIMAYVYFVRYGYRVHKRVLGLVGATFVFSLLCAGLRFGLGWYAPAILGALALYPAWRALRN